MKKKKIMVIAEKYDGGLRTHLEIITKNIKDFDIIQIILRRDSFLSNIIEGETISFENFSVKNPYKFYKHTKIIKKVVVEEKIDLVHLHSTIAGISGLILAGLLWNRKVKFIYTPHAYYSQKPSLNSLKKYMVLQAEKLICIYPSKVIHVSKAEEKHALENNIVRKNKSRVIYNGIKKREILEASPSNTFVFGNLARITYQKNPERFVEIAAYIIKNSSVPVKFIYGGGGPGLEEMRSLIIKENLQESIEFIGYVENIEEFFSRINGYLSTSHYEGLPYSVVEAASFGLPLFLSNVIGHTEMIQKNGILFSLDDSNEKIGNSIIQLIEKKPLIEEAGRQSLNMFEQLFEETQMVERLNSLYYGELETLK